MAVVRETGSIWVPVYSGLPVAGATLEAALRGGRLLHLALVSAADGQGKRRVVTSMSAPFIPAAYEDDPFELLKLYVGHV